MRTYRELVFIECGPLSFENNNLDLSAGSLQKQCEHMAARCIELILSIEEGTEGLEGTKAAALAHHLRPYVVSE